MKHRLMKHHFSISTSLQKMLEGVGVAPWQGEPGEDYLIQIKC